MADNETLKEVQNAFEAGKTKAKPTSDAAKSMQGAIDYLDTVIDTEPAPEPGEAAIHCDTVLQRVACNGHMNWRSTIWGGPGWKSLWKDLGIRNIRSGLTKPAEADWKEIGAKLILVTASGPNPDRTQAAASLEVAAANPDLVLAIEGTNEPNNGNQPNWAANVISYQQWLFDKVNGMIELADRPVIGPSVWKRLDSGYKALGDMGATMDIGNLHYYTGGNKPTQTAEGDDSASSTTLDNAINDAKGLSGGKRITITETGWPVAGAGCALGPGFCTDRAQAKYNIRMICEALNRDVWPIATYTLLDDVRDPPRYHGIATQTLAKRPCFDAMKRFLALYNDPTPPAALGDLNYEVELTGDLRKLPLMQKSDGRFQLTFWNDVSSYDRTSFKDIDAPPVNIAIAFGKSMNFRYTLPTFQSNWTDLPASDHVELAIPDHIVHLEAW